MSKHEDIMRDLGITEEDFQPKSVSIFDRIVNLENEVSAMKTFINSLGKTELVGEGSADNPFVWQIGIDLIPNAYYLVNDIRYVYMGTEAKATEDNKPSGDAEADFDLGWTEF